MYRVRDDAREDTVSTWWDTVGPSRMPEVVFVTAHEQYTLRAIEVHALDYVVKPHGRGRITDALDHARERIRGSGPHDLEARLVGLMKKVGRRVSGAEGPAPPCRLAIREEGRVFFVNVKEIDWIEADDKRVLVHVGSPTHHVRVPLREILDHLDSAGFVPIHRSAAVNLHRIAEVRPWGHGDHVAVLHDGRKLRVSRRYRDGLFKLVHYAGRRSWCCADRAPGEVGPGPVTPQSVCTTRQNAERRSLNADLGLRKGSPRSCRPGPLARLWKRVHLSHRRSMVTFVPNLGRAPNLNRGGRMGGRNIDLLQGTLTFLILKALSTGRKHGYGVARWIETTTNDVLAVEEGSLYPALHRLQKRGLLEYEWGVSDNNRRAKFYCLTPAGERELALGQAKWAQFSQAVTRVAEA